MNVPSPAASFAFSPASPLGLTVVFADTSTQGPTSWSWSFGDGEASSQRNPTHTFPAAGRYAVTLTASNSGGSSTAAMTVVVGTGAESEMCSGGSPIVVLLVDPVLLSPVAQHLARYAGDLCSERYRVWLTNAVPRDPVSIRDYLADLWDRSGGTLAGAMLIGAIPYAYQWVTLTPTNPNIPPVAEEAISYQFYADLDGRFAASSGYAGAHEYSYDIHDGNVNWEIWVGVLPFYKSSTALTIDAVQRYFDKNHGYRSGEAAQPRAFLQIDEMQVARTDAEAVEILGYLREGTYAWTPFSNAPTAQIYFDQPNAAWSVQQGYAALQAGVADFTVADSHGWYGAAGRLTIEAVETTPIRTVFFWSAGCAVGNLDYHNVLTAIVYSPTSSVLAAKGTTNNSGGMGNNENGFYGHNIATAMASGLSLGSAVLSHVNVPLAWPWSEARELHLATPIIIGDPTLRLRQ